MRAASRSPCTSTSLPVAPRRCRAPAVGKVAASFPTLRRDVGDLLLSSAYIAPSLWHLRDIVGALLLARRAVPCSLLICCSLCRHHPTTLKLPLPSYANVVPYSCSCVLLVDRCYRGSSALRRRRLSLFAVQRRSLEKLPERSLLVPSTLRGAAAMSCCPRSVCYFLYRSFVVDHPRTDDNHLLLRRRSSACLAA
jgi:hypothetical protein